jgi:hypothetical protein
MKLAPPGSSSAGQGRREQEMSLPKRDVIATLMVVAAVALYVLWAADAAPAGLHSVRATGLVILGLGFAASASAVVPGFDQLMHGNRIYVAATSIVGLVAFGAGVQMLRTDSETALGVLVLVTVVLWAIATAHHALLASRAGHPLGRVPPHAAAH